jgi:hypothetical protein
MPCGIIAPANSVWSRGPGRQPLAISADCLRRNGALPRYRLSRVSRLTLAAGQSGRQRSICGSLAMPSVCDSSPQWYASCVIRRCTIEERVWI